MRERLLLMIQRNKLMNRQHDLAERAKILEETAPQMRDLVQTSKSNVAAINKINVELRRMDAAEEMIYGR